MENFNEQENRKELLILQNESYENKVKAQNIVLKHLDDAIENGDSATVVAMAEILKN